MKTDLFEEKLDQLSKIKISQVYNFQNFIRTELPINHTEVNESKSKIENEFPFYDRKNNIEMKMTKTLGILFDLHLLESKFGPDGNQELLVTCGCYRLEVVIYDRVENTYRDLLVLSDQEEEFCCIEYIKLKESNEDDKNCEYVILTGGERGIVRVISILINRFSPQLFEVIELKPLIGHRDSVNDIKINPVFLDLVITASKDNSVRLWNYSFGILLMIFGGKEGHEVMVISLDWHFTGKTFSSGGGDRIKIWEVPTEIISINENEVKLIAEGKKSVPTLISFPIFSADIHCSYVDGIVYIGDIIVSKSINEEGGEIVEWAPFRFNEIHKSVSSNNIARGLQSLDSQGFCYFAINRYFFPLKKTEDKLEKIFYFKMSYCKEHNMIIVGNNEGKAFLFQRNTHFEESNYIKTNPFFYELQPVTPNCEINLVPGTIRKAVVHDNVLYAVNDYGTLLRTELK